MMRWDLVLPPAPCVLATLVNVIGSSYRQPGARMLIHQDGSHVGTLSGGCLERDIAREAWPLTADGAAVATYDTRADAFLPNGRYGSGCDGVVHVLLQRHPGQLPCDVAAALADHDQDYVLLQLWEGTATDIGHSALWRNGQWLSACPLPDQLLNEPLAEVVSTRRSARLRSGERRALLEFLPARPELLLIGAGFDARALAELAMTLGWRVRIASPDPLKLTSLPATLDRHVLQDATLQDIAVGPACHIVIMTHQLELDLGIVRAALDSPAPYVGLLGPKPRTRRLLQRWHAEGSLPSAAALAKLRTPVGLDLGSEDPRGVALSILAEIVAVAHGRSGGPLGARSDAIHTPLREFTLPETVA